MNTNPVVLDIETSGLDKVNCGIWQIGAIDLDDTKEVFFESSSIDDDDIVEDGALRVIGKTEDTAIQPTFGLRKGLPGTQQFIKYRKC